MVLPTFACREAIMTNAVKAAVNGISACAPEDSGVAVTLSVCASEQTIWLAFINQIKVAFCYIFGVLVDVQTFISEFGSIHSGTPSVAVGGAIGAGGTAVLLDGSTDTQGGVIITCGTAPTDSGGTMAILTFGTPFNSQVFPIITVGNTSAPTGLTGAFVAPPTSGGPFTTPVTALGLIAESSSATPPLGDGDSFIISYRIGYPA